MIKTVISHNLVILLVIFLFIVSGCGGGGGKAQIKTVTGTFIDDLVQGIAYRCTSGTSGVTSSKGEYTCKEGEMVTFILGEKTLSSLPVRSTFITPYSLFPNDLTAALNLARLLQAIDADNDPTNGLIVIDENLALPSTIDFSSTMFEKDIEDTLSVTLISAEAAQKRLHQGILAAGGTPPTDKTIPVSHAGVDQTVFDNTTITLDGSQSSDSDNDPLTYQWEFVSKPRGSNAILSDRTAMNPSFYIDVEGQYLIELLVNDGEINSATDSVTIFAKTQDTLVPVITLLGSNPATVNHNADYADGGATATDAVDGTVAVIQSGEVDTKKVGSYTLTYTATDKAGNRATATRIVNVIAVISPDETPPIINIIGNSPIFIDQNTTYIDAGAIATDNVDTSIRVTTVSSVDTATVGAYQVTYSAIDSAGNKSTATRTVTVNDKTPPVISMVGDNPITIDQNTTYNDPGATATDIVDGSIDVSTTGDIDTSTASTYTLTYTAEDKAKNKAIATRTVIVKVVPKAVKKISIITASITLTVDEKTKLNALVTYDDNSTEETTALGWEVADNTVAEVIPDTVITSTLLMGEEVKVEDQIMVVHALKEGSTTLVAKKDTVTSDPITIIVEKLEDKAPPVVTLLGNNPTSVMQGETYAEAGVTAIDDVDGTVSVDVTGGVDITTTGSYTITYTATDEANNTTSITRVVNVKKDAVLSSLVYAELTGRSGHQGIRPLQREPTAGTVYLLINTEGDVTSITANVITSSGDEKIYTTETPQQIITEGGPDGFNDGVKEWVIQTEIPAGESSILVTLIASNGKSYLTPVQTIVTSSIGLKLSRSDVDFSPGPNTVSVSVTNHGEEDEFLISATDNYDLVGAQFIPQTVTIGKEGSQIIDIPLDLLAENMQGDIFDYKISVTVRSTLLNFSNTAKMDINFVKAPAIVSDKYKLVIINPNSCSPISKSDQTVEVIIAGSEKLFLDKVDFDSIIWMNGKLKPLTSELADKVSFKGHVCGSSMADGMLDLVMSFSLQDIINTSQSIENIEYWSAYIGFYNTSGFNGDILRFTMNIGE